jgi:putative oxidoreductase
MIKKMELPWDIGLLIMRLGIGASMLIFHGYGKISLETAVWKKIWSMIKTIKINSLAQIWEFMALFSGSTCALLIVLFMIGVLFRPMTVLLAFTMLIEILKHLTLPEGTAGAGWSGAAQSLELLIIFSGLLFLGPGRFVATLKKQ